MPARKYELERLYVCYFRVLKFQFYEGKKKTKKKTKAPFSVIITGGFA